MQSSISFLDFRLDLELVCILVAFFYLCLLHGDIISFEIMNVITSTSHLTRPSVHKSAAALNKTNGVIPFRQFYDDLALFWQIVPVFILLFGIFGNVMTIVICKRAEVMSSMSVYFVTLAGSDLLLLIVNVAREWIYSVLDTDLLSLHGLSCKLIVYVGYVTGVLSAWILVAMTAQRAVCVLWPHRASILCSARNSKATAASLTLFIAVLHCHVLYGFDFVIFDDSTSTTNNTAANFNENTHSTTNTAAVCTLAKEYTAFYYSIWSWVDLMIFSILPWLCLVVSNNVLLWTLSASVRHAQHSLGSAHTEGFSGRKKQASSMTVTFIAVSTAFIVLNLPMSCIQVASFYHYIVGSLDSFHQSDVYAYCNEIALALWGTNSAVNFYLYCLTGSKFRRELRKTFSCMFCALPDARERDTRSPFRDKKSLQCQ